MFETSDRSCNPDYAQLELQLAALLAGERNFVTNAAQFSAFIFQTFADLNWAGFYLAQEQSLILGPFQGKVACVRIPFGRGVCGTAAVQCQTIVVADVHAFDGHIACDAASNSEIVLPVMAGERLLGVFDIDSPVLNRFSEADRIGLEQLIRCFVTQTDPM